jgi:TonB-linked SusC/RagA family outer membrane protein
VHARASLIAGALLVLAASGARAQAGRGTVTGRVTDTRSSQPVAQVIVEVDGTRQNATTGDDGRYRITNVVAGSHVIVARRIGYAAVRRTVSVADGRDVTADFALEVAAVSLDQVVVTGTAGGEQRRSIGNAIASVSVSDELAKSAAVSFTQLLSARAPGLNILSTTGRVGAVPSIQIRGRSSLSLSNSPLIYIDGVRVTNATGVGPSGVSGGLGTQGAGVGGRLNDINTDDIESIEVISGPAAATVYGTEAASGVIQIITKRGRAGNSPQLSFRVEEGPMYFRDAEGRVQTNYAKDKTGTIITWNGVKQEADSGRPLFKTGLTRQYNGAVAGGAGQTRYYVASGYENDYGIEPNNSLRQFTTHANLSTPLGTNSDGAVSLNFVDASAHLGADVGASALLGAQVGHSVLFPASRGFYPNFPPQVPQQLYDNAAGTNRFTGSATVNNRPTDWFTQRAVIGMDYTGDDRRAIERFAPPELATFLSAAAAGGRIGQTLAHNTIITADYNGTARVNLRPTLSSASSVGGQFYNTESNASFLGGSGFPAPGVETVSATAQQVAASQSQVINTTIGAYAQEQIGWRDRLFLTGAVRVDNNSAFGEQLKWVTYPKLSASWVISEEPFWRWSSSIPALRLRAAYGESGRSPSAFAALRTFNPVTGFNGASGVTPGTIGNPDLQPELGKELELGFEGTWKNRLTVDVTYFNKHTLNEIVNQAVAPSSGFPGSRSANLGRVDNKGIEAQATLQAVQRRNLQWDINANIGTNADVIRDLGGIPSLISAAGGSNQVGYPIGGFWSRRVVAATRDANGFATGIQCDSAGVKQVTCGPASTFDYLGTPTPKVTGSVANTITIRNRLRLYALTDFKRGHMLVNNVELLRCTAAIGVGLCRANYFPNEYDVLYMAEATGAALASTGQYLDQYYSSGSFVKLREISATYMIPQGWVRGISDASFSLSARELHTWTNYRGLDPEGLVGGSDQAVTPPLQRILATFNVKW